MATAVVNNDFRLRKTESSIRMQLLITVRVQDFQQYFSISDILLWVKLLTLKSANRLSGESARTAVTAQRDDPYSSAIEWWYGEQR